jgi:hypothetical protein
MGWRRRAWTGPWPGRGPFSDLPPWQRPGWVYGGRGFGRGWWWANPAYAYQPPKPAPEDELAALEDYKKQLGDEKASIEQEINEIETQIKELKNKLESKKGQATGP